MPEQQIDFRDPLVGMRHQDEVIQFLRENGVEVQFEPVCYVTPVYADRQKYMYGEHAGSSGFQPAREKLSLDKALARVLAQHEHCNSADVKWVANNLRERADRIEHATHS